MLLLLLDLGFVLVVVLFVSGLGHCCLVVSCGSFLVRDALDAFVGRGDSSDIGSFTTPCSSDLHAHSSPSGPLQVGPEIALLLGQRDRPLRVTQLVAGGRTPSLRSTTSPPRCLAFGQPEGGHGSRLWPATRDRGRPFQPLAVPLSAADWATTVGPHRYRGMNSDGRNASSADCGCRADGGTSWRSSRSLTAV
jgi:hypothetical protein